MASRMRQTTIAMAVTAALAWPAVAGAQYFGQNKVRHRDLNFQVLKTEHFDVHYYDEKREAAEQVGRMAERWYARLSAILGHELSSRQPLVLYASHPDFRSTTVVPGGIGETTGGLTDGLRRRIVMPMASSLAETDHVLGHELVHAFQFDITSRDGGGGPGALRLPLWFVEGMAEYLSLGPVDPNTAMWVRDAVRREALPEIKDLDNPRYFPYRWGHAFWAYVAGKYGDRTIAPLLVAAARTGDPEAALKAVLNVEPKELTAEWHGALTQAANPVIAAAETPGRNARALFPSERGGARLNLAPMLSPDGRQVVFFSERDLVSIDLFLADAETGRLIRKLTETAVSPHVDSLQFAYAGGGWDRTGQRFAFGTINTGRAELSIYDVSAGRVSQRLPLGDVAELLSLTWSPDGRSIVLSGMSGGHTDLFRLELASGRLTRLTADLYADLQPAWSPDGRTIAFSTERFASDLGTLDFGSPRIALLDVATGEVRQAPGFSSGKHVGPQWSPDGAALFFVSDRAGVPNIYRLSLADGRLAQVTNLQTGVSGISPLSPAFSLAATSGRLAFSAFDGGNYRLYVLDEPGAVARALDAPAVTSAPAALPPLERASQDVASALASPRDGLVSSEAFETAPYKSKLQADYVAPLSVGVGFGGFGPSVGGGTALYWSDLLGEQNLMVGLQTTTLGGGGESILRNLSGMVGYQNQSRRWTWGATAGQFSYPYSAWRQGFDVVNGEPAITEEELRSWQISREVSAALARPFNRAQRVEVSAGFQNISFALESRLQAFSAFDGTFLGERREDLPSPSSLWMATTSAAYVYDTSVSAGTSPVMGQRARFEAGTATGSLNFATLLADYRRYVPLGGPFTFAGRVMHYGRYGGGAEDDRLPGLFLGYPALVRGYDGNSFTAAECASGPASGLTGCAAYDRLYGSRLAVANAELRLSVVGYRGLLQNFSLPPVEAAFFVDAGAAWSSASLTERLGLERKPVTSYGASLRVNLFGFIGQISRVYANDRPIKQWRWEFSISPGF